MRCWSLDETGDLKKGTATAGVQRQYTGTAGRIENAQVAVYLGYAAPAGHALIDRELYLPRSWTGDPARCRAAGIPDGTGFATKPQLARRMIERAVTAGVPFAWFAADEAYGDNGPLRAWLEDSQVRYVLAVSCDHRVPAGAGRALRADQLAARLPRRAWQRLSAGQGAKGHRYYDWAWIGISDQRAGMPLAADPPPPRAPGNWPSTAATPRSPSPWPPWSRSPGAGGPSKRIPGRQGPDRPGRASGPPLDLLVPVGHPGHARQPPSSPSPPPPSTPASPPRRADPADPQRDRQPARHPDQPRARRPAPAALVPWRRRHQHRAQACHYQRQAMQTHEDHDLRLEY